MTLIKTSALANYTTIKVGGVPASMNVCETAQELYEAAIEAWLSDEEFHVLAGGSNTVFADDLRDLNIIFVANKGIEVVSETETEALIRVQAGEWWDDFVAWCVSRGYAGVEAMSGIPGSTGATPVQNVGGYGQEVSQVITQVEFLDKATHLVEIKPASFFEFNYRDSALKHELQGVIGWVEFRLQKLGGMSVPMASGQITNHLGEPYGSQLPLQVVRDTVLQLRSSKGMVVKPEDFDSVSCGSFFTNPVVSYNKALEYPEDMQRWEMESGDVKLSAGWLIEQAGFPKGYSLPGSNAGISAKHALAIINKGGASGTQILELARLIQERVAARWGINLVPEPNLIGF
ncbi:UDP-N-acetylmuramate dehydrogenase [Candidatus Aquiluna sp. UB-MaderosW2red]|uniref:UDP-N-acetylmuramate dehydrogenase n=1 Tax=Candidatus Aquiluna sp. UB-MaderosW2red TaxID=1855377 RepID=UPI000875C917|nr:UDP-N-acetylmuramate dehydrogenase [Candidatus Aquiluna sp. UB-MaderosW2red]SCX15566.1 UDP-N-acetylmuramate dehydrogenase [Candidatus Aquiluna sp. UB-MaderosW2red]